MWGKIITEPSADPSLSSSGMPFQKKKKNPTNPHKTYLLPFRCITPMITTDTRGFLIKMRTKPYKIQYLKNKVSQFALGISKKYLVK